MKKAVASTIRSILRAPSQAEADRLLAQGVERYASEAPELSEWMEQNIPESLTVIQYPEAHRRRLRTSNIAERVNREIARRTKVAGIFPNVASCLRLVTAVVMEIDEEWQQGKLYLSIQD